MLAEGLDYVPVSRHVVQLVEDTWADIKMPDVNQCGLMEIRLRDNELGYPPLD